MNLLPERESIYQKKKIKQFSLAPVFIDITII